MTLFHSKAQNVSYVCWVEKFFFEKITAERAVLGPIFNFFFHFLLSPYFPFLMFFPPTSKSHVSPRCILWMWRRKFFCWSTMFICLLEVFTIYLHIYLYICVYCYNILLLPTQKGAIMKLYIPIQHYFFFFSLYISPFSTFLSFFSFPFFLPFSLFTHLAGMMIKMSWE